MKGIHTYWVVFTLLVSGFSFEARAQLPYGFSPDWRSADRNYATGGQFADIDRDGWLDWMVSNGNDMRRERVAVYYNRGGVLETSLSWVSSDIAYHGHLTIGDINQDGWLDVVVAVLLPQGGPGVKVYLNQQGRFSSSPDWVSVVSFYGWHPALGDPDGDGDLDLAIGGFWPYGSGQTRHFIFFNHNGILESIPSWEAVGGRGGLSFTRIQDRALLKRPRAGLTTMAMYPRWLLRISTTMAGSIS